jgi:hypothetical protein
METLDSVGIQLSVLTELKEYFNEYISFSFACLHCVMSVSVHYRLCSETDAYEGTAGWEASQIFKNCWCLFSLSVCNQTVILIGVSVLQFPRLWRNTQIIGRPSAERNGGRKLKLGERDHHILKWIVFEDHKITAEKVKAELNIHLEDPVSKKKKSPTRASQIPTCTVQLKLINLWLLKTKLRRKKWAMIINPGSLIIWSDVSHIV